jgi:hypothetical protein
MNFTTIEDMVLDCFPNLCEEDIKKIMIEIVYFWQEPTRMEIYNHQTTQRLMVEHIGNIVMSDERFEYSKIIEMEFLHEYGCTNIKRYGKYLKL